MTSAFSWTSVAGLGPSGTIFGSQNLLAHFFIVQLLLMGCVCEREGPRVEVGVGGEQICYCTITCWLSF